MLHSKKAVVIEDERIIEYYCNGREITYCRTSANLPIEYEFEGRAAGEDFRATRQAISHSTDAYSLALVCFYESGVFFKYFFFI